MMRGNRGQAGVEFALMLPILLLILLGIADLGRAFYYTSAVASAAHGGAAAYAVDRNADVQSAACGALGPMPLCTATAAPTYIDANRRVQTGCGPGASASDAAVQVTYRFELLSGFLVTRIPIFSNQEIDIRACATSPRMSQ